LRRVRAHAALAWVTYLPDSGRAHRSLLLLIKPGITDDMPADLNNYQITNPDFPHESTLDQFFDEAQWESYRKLGELISTSIFASRVSKKWFPHMMSPSPTRFAGDTSK
jgi:hypothetical protein